MCFDADFPKVFRHRISVAFREYKCCECRVVIGRGEKYERFSGLYDDGWSTFATCSRCCDLRDRITRLENEMGCHGSEAIPPFGELWDVAHEMDVL